MKSTLFQVIAFLLVIHFNALQITAQSTFSKVFSDNWSPNILLASSQNEGVSFVECSDPTSSLAVTPIHLVELSSTGDVNRTTEIYADTMVLPYGWRAPLDYKQKGNTHVFQVMGEFILSSPLANKGALFVINQDEGIAWGKRTAQGIFLNLYVDVNTDLVVCSRASAPLSGTTDTVISIACYDKLSGISIWENNYQVTATNLSITGYAVRDIAITDNNFTYVLGEIESTTGRFNIILKLSPDGEILNSIILSTPELTPTDIVTDDLDQVFIAGKFGNTDGYIIGLNQQLEVNWAKRLQSDYLSYNDLKIFYTQEKIFFFVVDPQFIPVIAGQFNISGELLHHYGYATEFPSYNIDNVGNTYLLSPYLFRNNEVQYGYHLIKDNPLGTDTSCIRFPSCLNIENIDISFIIPNWSVNEANPLSDFPVNFTNISLTTFDFCEPLPPVTPYFELVDSLCYGSSISPYDLENEYANANEWHIYGPGLDTIFTTTSFVFTPPFPGSYVIEQTIWVLGCAYREEKEIVVLPDDLVIQLPDTIFSCNDILNLNVTANRPILDFTWEDGSILLNRSITTPGIYKLEASDGYCETEHEINIAFLNSTYEAPFLTIPDDTNICKKDLPLRIQPESPYVNEFFLNNEVSNGPFFLSEGEHTFYVQIENCLIPSSITISPVNCENIIYLPNVFSPNEDGINDYWQPKGSNFEVLALSVFNRWGGNVFRTTSPPFRWDGKSQTSSLNTDQVVISITYRNLITEKIITTHQSVLLLK